MKKRSLSPAAAGAEMEKCLHCALKPCQKACPLGCSPCNFIAAAKKGDWQNAAQIIRDANPLGETCGLICPDKFCRRACLRAKIDYAVKIPSLQSYIMAKAGLKSPDYPENENKKRKIAVIGTGPAGISAAYFLLLQGFGVEFFEKEKQTGGALNLIPEERLPHEVFKHEWRTLFENTGVKVHLNTAVSDYSKLLSGGFAGIIVATGEPQCRRLGISGEEFFVSYMDYLHTPEKYVTSGNVAVIGGGAVAVDCALTARKNQAANVEMFVRRRLSDMRIDDAEYHELLDAQIDITAMTRVSGAVSCNGKISLYTTKTRFNPDGKLEDIPETTILRPDYSLVILALGCNREETPFVAENIIYAGDCVNGSSTAVEAAASGKAAAEKLLLVLKN